MRLSSTSTFEIERSGVTVGNDKHVSGRLVMKTGEVLAEKYKIVRQLGSGGEGSVYLALHLQTELFWAVKEIFPTAIREDRREKEKDYGMAIPSFSCNELEVMKSLRNGHLPQIIDVIQQYGKIFLVMEYVRGESLDEILKKRQRITCEQAMNIALQVSEALCYLESRDPPVCHLDIKPSNLICRHDGLIKLVDFGSAWNGSSLSRGTGTIGYAAPEQYKVRMKKGQKGTQVDGRADIYALGATMYRMITGQVYSENLGSSKVPFCPRDLGNVILRCLEHRNSDRYRSAREMKEALLLTRRRWRARKARMRATGALAIAFSSVAVCVSIPPSSSRLPAQESWGYGRLLSEARVVDESEGREYYKRAVCLDPGRNDVYLQYLDDVELDGVFDAEEELFLRDLLHTVGQGSDETNEEILEKRPEQYGQAALRIGLAYWYSYEGDSGKRIATGWFAKAEEEAEVIGKSESSQESVDEVTESIYSISNWRELSAVYHKLGTCTAVFGGGALEEKSAQAALDYWENSGILLSRIQEIDVPLMRMKAYREVLTSLAFITFDLASAGISPQEQIDRIRDIILECSNVTGTKAQEKILEEIREEAERAGEIAIHTVENLKMIPDTEEGSNLLGDMADTEDSREGLGSMAYTAEVK